MEGKRELVYYYMTVILTIVIGVSAEPNVADIKDYCQFETFNATCRHDEVVVMTSATYGRMRFGRCVDRDYGYVGCSADVLLQVDKRCSGRHACTIAVPDSDLHSRHPCPKDLTSYFEASYKCEKIKVGPQSQCSTSPAIIKADSGTIARVTAIDSGYGTDSCPWLLQAEPGQRINITMLDFSVDTDTKSSMPPDYCRAYAIVRDRQTGRSTTVCGGHARESVVYLSQSNSVEIRVIRAAKKDQTDHFLLKYQTIGCPQFRAPRHAHVHYEGGSLLVTCNGTGQTWNLHCEGSKWIGRFENCSQAAPWGIQEVIGNFTSLPFELTAVLIASIAFVVIVFVLVMGFVCLRRRHYQGRPLPRPNPLIADPYDKNQYNGTVLTGKEYASTLGMRNSKQRAFSGEYASIWESQYPMTMSPHLPGQEDTFAAPMAVGIPENGYTTHPALPEIPPALPPRVEHIYESPKFERSDSSSRSVCDLPVYYELDAEADQAHSSTMPRGHYAGNTMSNGVGHDYPRAHGGGDYTRTRGGVGGGGFGGRCRES